MADCGRFPLRPPARPRIGPPPISELGTGNRRELADTGDALKCDDTENAVADPQNDAPTRASQTLLPARPHGFDLGRAAPHTDQLPDGLGREIAHDPLPSVVSGRFAASEIANY